MYQLTYISTARPGVTDADVDNILARSRRNNGRDQITGLLIHDGRRFLQVLEGPQPLVDAAFARIKADERHRATVFLSAQTLAERQFGVWAMACERVRATLTEGSIADTVDALVRDVADPNIRALFSGFARIERRPAA